ncbi:MAG: hypothetical protein LUC26_04695 [Prevotella sp.]|nr:hypothetical protein [Prevotella sp.]
MTLSVGATILIVCSCSTQKNTGKSRFWQSFTAKYNTYYNGTLAYIDGSLEKEQGNRDNFTELLPLYYVGNKNSVELGSANFDRAIEKSEKAIKLHSIKKRPVWNKKRRKTDRDIEWLNRKEYNPMLWKAWLLMGRSQFHKGDFDGAASTFSYMSRLYQTQPAIYGKARAWLAKAYTEADYMYDAEDVIRKMSRDSIHWSARKEWNYTYTDYYLHTEEYDKAIPYLREVIKREGRRKQKAREWFILGQLYALTNDNPSAYKAYKHVFRQHPPYELQFNARIAMTEVAGAGQSRRMISKLKGMARNDNNKDYLDQVYYAMGNIYMTQPDTLRAVSAYEKGNEKSTRNGIEKGVLLLRLGDIYWDMEKFSDASRCYDEAIGLLDKDRKDYAQLADRSQKLDLLVPFTESIHLQDSLQELSTMSEDDRNAAIDRVITALKKKEKEERDAAAIQAAQETIAQNSQNNGRQTAAEQTDNSQVNGVWYFYSPQAVNQGKQAFQRQWGKRENVDHWQRSNRTVVDFGNGEEEEEEEREWTEEQLDSIQAAQAAEEELEAKMDSAVNDPHQREYYLAQIPFTEEQKEASNEIIMDALYNSGVIFKDKLDMLRLSEKQFTRLLTQYPDYYGMDNAYYHLFLLYSRLGMPQVAEGYIARLKNEYPESQWTALLSDPYFAENQRFGVQMEDSLYAATYDAFKADRFGEIRGNVKLSGERFPLGFNRDKFIFIGGLGKLNAGDADGCLDDMNTLVANYPDSRLAELAGMIINGVKQGRALYGGKFDMGDVWARRSQMFSDNDSIAEREFSDEANTDFLFVIAYEPDSVDTNQLLYQLARFNFSNYLVRNFDMEAEAQEGIYVFRIGGFNSYFEAREYAQDFYRQESIQRLLGKARTFLISRDNLALIGLRFSYDDYDAFFAEHFDTLPLPDEPLLTEPGELSGALDDGGSIPGNISPILEREREEYEQMLLQQAENEALNETESVEGEVNEGEGEVESEVESENIEGEEAENEVVEGEAENEAQGEVEGEVEGEVIENEEVNIANEDEGDFILPEDETGINIEDNGDGNFVIPEEGVNFGGEDDGTFEIDDGNGPAIDRAPDADNGGSLTIDDDAADVLTTTVEGGSQNGDGDFIIDDDEDENASGEGDTFTIDDYENEGTEDEYFELDGF